MGEQFLDIILPEDARVAVIERQAKDSQEAAWVAGNFLQACSMSVKLTGKEKQHSNH